MNQGKKGVVGFPSPQSQMQDRVADLEEADENANILIERLQDENTRLRAIIRRAIVSPMDVEATSDLLLQE